MLGALGRCFFANYPLWYPYLMVTMSPSDACGCILLLLPSLTDADTLHPRQAALHDICQGRSTPALGCTGTQCECGTMTTPSS